MRRVAFPRKQRVLRVFYRDLEHGSAVSSLQPESLLADRIVPLAERILQHADNFIGVVDAADVVLQAYPGDNPDSVILELVYPDDQGVLRREMPRAEALALLSELPEAFDEQLLPGAQYIG